MKEYIVKSFIDDIDDFKPSDAIEITVKVHGVPFIYSEYPEEEKQSLLRSIFGTKPKITKKKVCVSHSDVIDLEKTENALFKQACEIISDFVPDNMTFYGELVGYKNEDELIHDGYDYGCDKGGFRIMPYNIVTLEDGKERVWGLMEIYGWIRSLIRENKELSKILMPPTFIYRGFLNDFSSDVFAKDVWKETLIEILKEKCELNKKENLCNNNVVREGIVIRKNDIVYVLKSDNFEENQKREV